MNRHWASKVMAAAVLGILLGSYIQHDYATWNRLGQQAFMNHELLRFGRYMALPQSIFRTMAGATVVALGLAGLYELFVLFFFTLLKRKSSENGNQ